MRVVVKHYSRVSLRTARQFDRVATLQRGQLCSLQDSDAMKRKGLPAFRPPSSDRSQNMRAIRSTANATTEKRLISLLLRCRLRGWRVRPKDIPGTPDFVFPRSRLAIFCDGCFFHGCPKCGHIPKTNVAYWRAKILRNRRRDAKGSRKL